MADIVIIGSGIAGCMTAHQLQRAGADVLLLERHTDIAAEASGNPYGLVMPQLSVEKSAASEFNMQAYQTSIQFYDTLDIEKQPGILQCAVTAEDETRFGKLANQPKNTEFFKMLDTEEASTCLGLSVSRPALWFPNALTISPQQLCQQLIKNIQTKFSTNILAIQSEGNLWQLKDKNNNIVAKAKKIVLANALDVLRFPGTTHLPLRARRGQLSFLPVNDKSQKIKTSFTFGGYMTKATQGIHILGATYEQPRTNPSELTPEEHEKNLTKLHTLLPDLFSNIQTKNLPGRAAIRTTTPDHLPIVGSLPDHPGLYVFTGLGSRGLTTAFLSTVQLCEHIFKNQEIKPILQPERFKA